MSNPILNKAAIHFKKKLADLHKIEVPEWEETIYYRNSLRMKEQATIVNLQQAGKPIDAIIQTLILRALDKDGKRVFSKADKLEFEMECDPAVLVRIVAEMNDVDMTSEDLEDIEKN